MGFFADLEHSVEKKADDVGHALVHGAEAVGHGVEDVAHGVENAARVGATLAEGAWNYGTSHPGEVAKTALIAVGTGLAIGAATAFMPECAILGAGLTIAGAIGGGVGLASIGEQAYESVKHVWPDLKVVWDADQHSSAEVTTAEKNVEDKTGESMANIAMLIPSFWVGNIAGNLGADAGTVGESALFGSHGMSAATSAAASDSAAVVAASDSAAVAAASDSAAAGAGAGASEVGTGAAQFMPMLNAGVDSLTSDAASGVSEAESALAAQSGDPSGLNLMKIWSYAKTNPLEARTDFWTQVNNNNAYGFLSNYYLEPADVRLASRLATRFVANPGYSAPTIEKITPGAKLTVPRVPEA